MAQTSFDSKYPWRNTRIAFGRDPASACVTAYVCILIAACCIQAQTERPTGKFREEGHARNNSVTAVEVHGFNFVKTYGGTLKKESRFAPSGKQSRLSPEATRNDAVVEAQADIKRLEEGILTVDDMLAKARAGVRAPGTQSSKAAPAKRKPPIRPPIDKLVLAIGVTTSLSAIVSTLGMCAYCSSWPFSLFYSEPVSSMEFVQGYVMSDRFTGNLIYSIVVPDSLELAETMSEGAIYSGWVIGIYKGLAWLGLAVGLLLCGLRNKNWMHNLWICIVSGKVMAFVGSVVFLVIVVLKQKVPHANVWLLLGRSVAGIGVGLVVLPVELVLVHTTSIAERPLILSKAVFHITLGIGMGPLVASATRGLHEALCGSEYGAVEAVMCWPVIVSIVSIVAAFYIPDAKEYIDTGSHDFETTQLARSSTVGETDTFVEELDYNARRLGIMICVLIIGLRAAIVSGLEAATAMLLERDYKMPKAIIGVVIGLTFLVSVPARFIFMYCKDVFSIREWIRLMMFISFFGSCFLFRTVARMVAPDPAGPQVLLLIADSLLYCSIYQASGLVEGIMTTFALPVGSFYTVDSVIVLKTLALDCIGRLLGPPLARMQVEKGGTDNGQDGYAWQQLSMTLMAALLTEAVLLRVMDVVEAIPRRPSVTTSARTSTISQQDQQRCDQADDTDIPNGQRKETS